MSSKKGRILLVFAKEPSPGKAKTRLAATVGPERAGALALAFLEDTLDHAAEAARRANARLRVVHTPATEPTRAAFEALGARLGHALDLRPQVEDASLGVRLEAAFDVALDDAEDVVAIGTDSPDLDPDDYLAAFAALERSPATLGPARDGGYWAVGLRRGSGGRGRAFLDPIAWSTSRAFADTRAALERRGLAVEPRGSSRRRGRRARARLARAAAPSGSRSRAAHGPRAARADVN